MEFRVLGPLEVFDSEGAVPITGPKRRALLALFVANAGRVLSRDTIVDSLWSGEPPPSGAGNVQTFISDLRNLYGIEALRTTAAGYVLDVPADAIDAARFDRAADAEISQVTRAPVAAATGLRAALAMWRGDAYADFASEGWAVAEAARLEQQRLEVVEALAVAAIGAGNRTGVIGDLEVWARRNPLRESLWALRMLVLAHDGRTAEALRVATELRAVLGEELGVDPSPLFTAVETGLIRGEAPPAFPELGGFGLRSPPPADTSPADTPPAAPVAAANPARTSDPSHLRLGPRVLQRSRLHHGVLAFDALPRSSFVGRAHELALLGASLDEARAGLPCVLLVIGQAGIGKTRLLDEFMSLATTSGARTLRGACQDDVEVPYLPVASALASLGGDPFLLAEAPAQSDDPRLRYFLAVTEMLLSSSADQPVLLVIEDVHWADTATLGLLRHLISAVTEEAVAQRSRLMLVITARGPDFEPASPAASFLTRASRERGVRSMNLRPFGVPECRELIAEAFGGRPSLATVDRLVDATGGNPLVLQSALARLRELGVSVGDAAIDDLVGPTDLDHELWRRIERLGDECREFLLTAAFLGEATAIALLGDVCGFDLETSDALVDEAISHHVLIADDEHYWFEHPQLRQLVYHWPTGRQRAARHLMLAERLTPLDADVLVIAHHLARAGDLADDATRLAVCGRAADRSAAVGAWQLAARNAAVALAAARRLDLPIDEVARIEFRSGYCASVARDLPAALTDLTAAVEHARERRLFDTWGRAAVQLARDRLVTRDLVASNRGSLEMLDEFLTAAGIEQPALRAEVHALEAELYVALGDLGMAGRQLRFADELATELEDHDLAIKVAFGRGLQQFGAVELEAAAESFERVLQLSAGSVNPSAAIWGHSRLGLVAYVMGELDRASRLLDEAIDLARAADNDAELSMAAAVAASVAAVNGRSATAESLAERARRAYLAAEYFFTPQILFPTVAAARVRRGDAPGAHAALDEWDALQERRSRRYRPLIDALAGDAAAAALALRSPNFRLFAGSNAPDFFMVGAIAAQVELAALAGLSEFASGPLETLVECYERGMRFAPGWPAFLPRVIAEGFATGGDRDVAEEWFERAINDARQAGSAPELERCETRLGELTGRRGAPATGGGDAAAAIAAAEPEPAVVDDGVEGALETRRERAVTRTVLVTDLVGSTALNERVGDVAYVDRLREHDRVIRLRLREFDGVEFKHTGDGFGAWFFSANVALECASALARDFAATDAQRDTASMQVRIALSAGEPELVGTDLFGLAVTLAFRMLAIAEPGEVLVTTDTAGLCRGHPWSFESRGSHRLKGFADPVELLRVTVASDQN